MNISFAEAENELKKRWVFPFSWGQKQNNAMDSKTNFIYKSPFFEEINKKVKNETVEIQNYTFNRWYNFWSAKAVEASICQNKNIVKEQNPTNKTIDFYWEGIPFDHKTTVFPKGFNKSIEYAMQNPQELITWLYANQSTQGRFHLKNRFFIVLYDPKTHEHAKIKACLNVLHSNIHTFFKTHTVQNCYTISLEESNVLASVIWVIFSPE